MCEQALKVTVKRSQWLRGEGATPSYLFRDTDRKMCCLGFACRAAGMERRDIWNAKIPHSSSLLDNKLQLPLLSRGPWFAEAASINDTLRITSDDERERQLRAHGTKAGILFNFVD